DMCNRCFSLSIITYTSSKSVSENSSNLAFISFNTPLYFSPYPNTFKRLYCHWTYLYSFSKRTRFSLIIFPFCLTLSIQGTRKQCGLECAVKSLNSFILLFGSVSVSGIPSGLDDTILSELKHILNEDAATKALYSTFIRVSSFFILLTALSFFVSSSSNIRKKY